MTRGTNVAAISRRSVLGAAGLLVAAPLIACADGSEEFGSFRVKTPRLRFLGLKVHYFIPASAGPDAEVLVVMHGRYRDPVEYMQPWVEPARETGQILLAPEFDENRFEGSVEYNQGGIRDDRGRWRRRELWTFELLQLAVDAFGERLGRAIPGYSLYGHSAGAQFVHRFLAFMPQANVSRAVAANAGWYTFPTLDQPWPYGFGDTPLKEADLAAYLRRPLIVMLGAADNDPEDENLSRTEEAMRQGPHRYARGLAFFQAAQEAARRLEVRFGWELQIAPGVAHDNASMARIAAVSLFPAPQLAQEGT